MKLKHVLPMIMLALSFGIAVWRVNVWWGQARTQVYPERGDWDYYVQSCNHIPLDHPIVPIALHSLNLLVNNPVLTVLSMMTLGYTAVFFSVYILTHLLGCHPIACVVGFLIVALSQGFLSPTALKNIWAVAFLMMSLILLSRLEKGGAKLKIATFFTFILTLFTHTIAVFALFPILLCYTAKSLQDRPNKHTKFFVTSLIIISVLIMAGAFTPQLFRLGKLGNVASDFLNNPLHVVSYNLNYPLFHLENYVHFIIYLTAVAVGVVYFGYARRVDPMFFGLLLAYSGLFFLGSKLFAGRLHSTGIALLGVLYAYTITTLFYREGKP